MELAIVVYAINAMSNLGIMAFIALFIFAAAAIISWGTYFGSVSENDNTYNQTTIDGQRVTKPQRLAFQVMHKRVSRWFTIAMLACALVVVAIPDRKTSYIMVGAYAAQKIAESNGAEVISKKVLTIIEQNLDALIAEGTKASQK